MRRKEKSVDKKKKKIVSANHPIVQKKIEKSLELSVREGAFSSVSQNTGIYYFSPFAIFMKATNFQIGILSSFTYFVPSVAQLFSVGLIERFKRKKIVLFFVFLQLLMLIPIFLSGYLYYIGFDYAVLVMMIFAAAYFAFGGVAYPIWFSWMGSLVPDEIRGKYFSRKSFVFNSFGILTLILAALVLDNFKNRGIISGQVEIYTLFGFGILFLMAIVSRFVSFVYLARQYEPMIKVRKRDYFSFWQFIKQARKNPFGRFTIYRFFYSIAISVATPFWAVYMLKNLGFSYFWYIAVVSSGLLFQLAFLAIWGKLSDRFGNVSVIKFCSFVGALAPIIYVISALITSRPLLIAFLFIVPGFMGGIAWSGFLLATNNYVFDAVKKEKRSFGNSYMNLMVGMGAFIGSGIGSIIALFGVSFMNTLLFIFLVAFILRVVVAIWGLSYLKEVRGIKEEFKPSYFFREIHPLDGVVHSVHNVESFAKKVEHYV